MTDEATNAAERGSATTATRGGGEDVEDEADGFEKIAMGVARNARRELSASFATSSTVTRGICGALLAGWFARFAIFGKALDQVFALSPYAVFTRPWTLLTSGYYEMSLAAACVDACGLLYIGRTLEPIWGPKELTRFVVGVNVATATMSWFSMCLLYVFSGGDEFYLFARFAGFHGVLAALLLALRQTSPEEPVFGEDALGGGGSRGIGSALPSLRALRNKHLIGAYLCFTAAYAFMSGGRHHHVGLFLFDIWGAYSAWVYLRFFQPHGSGVRGDDSADFAFTALFPPAARPVIARVSAPVGAAARAIAERRRLAREASNATTTNAARPPPANTAADAAVRAKLEQKSSVVAVDEDADARAKRERLAERGRRALATSETRASDTIDSPSDDARD